MGAAHQLVAAMPGFHCFLLFEQPFPVLLGCVPCFRCHSTATSHFVQITFNTYSSVGYSQSGIFWDLLVFVFVGGMRQLLVDNKRLKSKKVLHLLFGF